VSRIVDRDHPLDGGYSLLDALDPEHEHLDYAKQLGELPFQFLFNAHIAPLQNWGRRLLNELVLVW
jgi:hypothetical protein